MYQMTLAMYYIHFPFHRINQMVKQVACPQISWIRLRLFLCHKGSQDVGSYITLWLITGRHHPFRMRGMSSKKDKRFTFFLDIELWSKSLSV